MIVVSDTSPLNYLILIGHIDVLPRVPGMIDMPAAIAGLRSTSFHASPQLYEEALRLSVERKERR